MQAERPIYMKKEAIGEVIRFCIAGVLVTAIHYAVYWLLQLIIDVNISWTAGYIAGFIVNYLLQMVLLNFFLWTGLTAELAPIGVYAVSTPVNFLLVRFVFKRFKGNH